MWYGVVWIYKCRRILNYGFRTAGSIRGLYRSVFSLVYYFRGPRTHEPKESLRRRLRLQPHTTTLRKYKVARGTRKLYSLLVPHLSQGAFLLPLLCPRGFAGCWRLCHGLKTWIVRSRYWAPNVRELCNRIYRVSNAAAWAKLLNRA